MIGPAAIATALLSQALGDWAAFGSVPRFGAPVSREADDDPARDPDLDQKLTRIWEMLQLPDEGPAPVEAELVARLESLGDSFVPAIMAARRGERPEAAPREREEVPDEEGRPVSRRIERREREWTETTRRALTGVLEGLPASRLREHLRAEAIGDVPIGQRLDAVHLMGQIGGAEAVSFLIDVAVDMDPRALASPVWTGTYRNALASILGRSSSAHKKLEDRWQALPDRLVQPTMHAIGEAADPAGLELLMRRHGRSGKHDLAVLQGIARASAAGHRFGQVPLLRAALASIVDGERRIAAQAMGDLHDLESFDTLASLLEDDDAGVRRCAHKSLQKMFPVSLPPEPELWRQWWRSEQRWLATEGARLVDELQSPRAATVLEALRGLTLRSHFRDEWTTAIVRLLVHELPAIRGAACSALASLGTPEAYPDLILAMEDEEQGVRNAAHASLRAHTRQNLPLDPGAWTSALYAGRVPSKLSHISSTTTGGE